MDNLSKNEAIRFLVCWKFPGYFRLNRARVAGRMIDKFPFEQDLMNSIAEYFRSLRRLPLNKIEVMVSAAEIEMTEESMAARAERQRNAEELDKELFFSYPRHQANIQHWAKFDFWTADEAVALSFGKNPKEVNQASLYEYTEISPFAKTYMQRLDLVERFCKSNGATDSIKPLDFIQWCRAKEVECPDRLIAQVTKFCGSHDQEVEGDEIEEKNNGTEAAGEMADTGDEIAPSQYKSTDEFPFDPVPIKIIAKIFKFCDDETENLKKWKKYARSAYRNGLNDARALAAKGRGSSLFLPDKVGQWLITSTGEKPQGNVNRILANNLPPRSAHLKDILYPK